MESTAQSERVFSGKRTKRGADCQDGSTLPNTATVHLVLLLYISWKWIQKKKRRRILWRDIQWWRMTSSRGEGSFNADWAHDEIAKKWNKNVCLPSESASSFLSLLAQRHVWPHRLPSPQTPLHSWYQRLLCVVKCAHNVSSATAFIIKSLIQRPPSSPKFTGGHSPQPTRRGLDFSSSSDTNGMHNASIFGW